MTLHVYMLTVKVHTESGKVEVTLPKCKPEYTWKTLGKSLPGDKSFLKASETGNSLFCFDQLRKINFGQWKMFFPTI